ncbi:MAG: zf-HC2 domain-containing protein [Gemmatimonadota bacterium]|nr:zf-HC2 domain-containing protein [Gemmatimonadota bacterium]
MTHRTDGELQAWLDAELDRDAAAEVAEHLLVCVDCRSRLGQLRTAAEDLRQALTSLDDLADAPAAAASSGDSGRRSSPSRRRRASRLVPAALSRAAVLLLVAAGAAAAIVPGSPLRDWIGRLTAPEVAPPSVAPSPLPAGREPMGAGPASVPPSPGVASVTVAPADGEVKVDVAGFAPGTLVRVRTVSGADVRARLVSGRAGARFSVGPGQLEVLGTAGEGPAVILLELPAGLRRATVEIDGVEVLDASADRGDGREDTGIPGPGEETVLRVGG